MTQQRSSTQCKQSEVQEQKQPVRSKITTAEQSQNKQLPTNDSGVSPATVVSPQASTPEVPARDPVAAEEADGQDSGRNRLARRGTCRNPRLGAAPSSVFKKSSWLQIGDGQGSDQ